VHDQREPPEQPGVARLDQCGVEDVRNLLVLAADVDERAVRAGCVGADDDALDQPVRVLGHQLAVLEGPGL
jgi:hypothetical protein